MGKTDESFIYFIWMCLLPVVALRLHELMNLCEHLMHVCPFRWHIHSLVRSFVRSLVHSFDLVVRRYARLLFSTKMWKYENTKFSNVFRPIPACQKYSLTKMCRIITSKYLIDFNVPMAPVSSFFIQFRSTDRFLLLNFNHFFFVRCEETFSLDKHSVRNANISSTQYCFIMQTLSEMKRNGMVNCATQFKINGIFN